MDVSMLKLYIIKKMDKIKVAKWGTPKKYLKKKSFVKQILPYIRSLTTPSALLKIICQKLPLSILLISVHLMSF
jgi:hypothetical protein